MQFRLLRALMMLFASHAPPCRHGRDCYKVAIDLSRHDLTALLRSAAAAAAAAAAAEEEEEEEEEEEVLH
jgi:hypothetical protein